MSAVVFRDDEGEVLRQASAVVGRPVVLWEIIGPPPHQAVARASSGSDVGVRPPGFDLDTVLQKWSVPVPVGSRWVSAPGPTPDTWVVAPVRARAPAGPPGGRERRSRERLALELAGLALGAVMPAAAPPQVGGADSTPAMQAHHVSNPLTAARAALQLSMEAIGRWVDLAADRRLSLLDDLGQVLEDLDRTSEMLRAMKDSARQGALTTRGERGGRFDVVRVVRSCLTLERRLLRDRGIELEFATSLETLYLKGDSNALFDLLVSLVRTAADLTSGQPPAVRVRLEQKGKQLEIVIRGGPRTGLTDLSKVRSVTEEVFSGTVRVESSGEGATTLTIALPLPPQREADRHPG